MKWFYGLANSLRLQEAFKVKSEVDLRVIERITFIRCFYAKNEENYKRLEGLWSFC